MSDPVELGKAGKGPDRETILEIAEKTGEPSWVTDLRFKSLEAHSRLEWPKWMPRLEVNESQIDYLPSACENCPLNCKPFSPSSVSCAAGAEQSDTEISYLYTSEELKKLGAIVTSLEEAVSKHEEIVKKYIFTLIPHDDNRAAALNGAMWSGGMFVYLPKGVKLEKPIYARFTSTAPSSGQFERTLIIAEEGSEANFIEGCTATYEAGNTMHCGVVEIFVGKNAKIRYSTIQNWGGGVYNLTTKRAHVEENGVVEWVDGNFGSKLTVKMPTAILAGRGARAYGTALAVTRDGSDAYSGFGSVHLADETKAEFRSKSIVLGGVSAYIGKMVAKKDVTARAYTRCDSTTRGKSGQVAAQPKIRSFSGKQRFEHESIASPVDADSISYLRTRGIPEDSAEAMILGGLVEDIISLFPEEFAMEFEAMLEAVIGDEDEKTRERRIDGGWA